MRYSIHAFVVLILGAIGAAQAIDSVSSDPADGYEGTWIQPDESSIPNDAEGDMENRINGCMQRSMNGSEMPRDSYEIQSMKAYMIWMSTGMQVDDWTQVVGQGNIDVPDLNEPGSDVVGLLCAADPVRGKPIFEEHCAVCHGYTGAGVFDANTQKYIYPSVWSGQFQR